MIWFIVLPLEIPNEYVPKRRVNSRAITGFPIKLIHFDKILSSWIKKEIKVEKPINNTGNKAVDRLLNKLGNSSCLNTFVVINSLRGSASTLGKKWVNKGPEIKIAGMESKIP